MVNPIQKNEMTQGNVAFKEGRFAQAVQHFTSALKICTDESGPKAVLHSNRSGAYSSLALYAEALADAEQATEFEPNWPRGYSRKAAALYGLGRYTESLANYDKGLSFEPTNPQMLQARSDVLARLESARELLEAAFSCDRARVSTLVEQGIHPDGYANEEGNTALLLACQSGSTGLVAELIAAGANASHLNKAGQDAATLAKAMGHEHLLTLLPAPKKSGATNLLAAVLGMGGASSPKADKADKIEKIEVAEIDKVDETSIENMPSDAAQLEDIEKYKCGGNDAFKAGSFAEAIKLYTKAIELSPDSHVLYSNRSGALAALGKYEQALADAERCVALSADWCKGHTRKASALHGLKRYLDAIISYDLAIKYEENNEALYLGRRQSSFALAMES